MTMTAFQGSLLKLADDYDMMAAHSDDAHTADLSRAMSRKLMVMFEYDDKLRHVEVHAIGRSTKDHSLVMRGFMPDDARPWRLFTIDKIKNLRLTFDDSGAPREGYTMDDKQMSIVVSQIYLP